MAGNIRIFPHAREEFPSLDTFVTWLHTSLKARNGLYNLRAKNAADVPPGSIVLFRYGQEIVGEAVVIDKKIFDSPILERTFTGAEAKYEARVAFVPSSIRLFVPAIPIDNIQSLINGTPEEKPLAGANLYYRFDDWSLYSNLLAVHIKNGGHFL